MIRSFSQRGFCTARSGPVREETVVRFGKPGVFNTDRAPFYCCSLHRHVGSAGVRIPMDDRGRWMDSTFIERLWRSPKHEDISKTRPAHSA
jgi:putative transposase